MIEKKLEEQPVRYTSYQSDKTFSILTLAKQQIKNNTSFSFEYNGLKYHFSIILRNKLKTNELWHLSSSRKSMFMVPYSNETATLLTEFNGDNFDEFIETFEIEGKTVKWVLEHQKEWKYKLTAEHFEKVLTGFSFEFVYRGVLCNITYEDAIPAKNPRPGKYLRIESGVLHDVTQYAPTTPGAEHWFTHHGLVANAKTPVIWMGPFETIGILLDKTGFDGKSLREIFDTEYDDGAVCCGVFDG